MSGFTAGPWKVVDDEWNGRPDDAISIMDARRDVFIAQAWSDFEQETLDAHPVDGIAPHGTAAANARLIAAAPDLLAALHLAAEALDAYSDVNDGEDGPTPNRAMSALQEIGAVIAKAEGKPR